MVDPDWRKQNWLVCWNLTYLYNGLCSLNFENTSEMRKCHFTSRIDVNDVKTCKQRRINQRTTQSVHEEWRETIDFPWHRQMICVQIIIRIKLVCKMNHSTLVKCCKTSNLRLRIRLWTDVWKCHHLQDCDIETLKSLPYWMFWNMPKCQTCTHCTNKSLRHHHPGQTEIF